MEHKENCFKKIINVFEKIPKNIYSVVAPGTIRANSQYSVAVSMHDAKEPAEIKIGINGPTFKNHQTVKVNPMSTETVKFDLKELEDGGYTLTVDGKAGTYKFTNNTNLYFEKKYFSVYIQTDKGTYKPEDLIRFRVLILDSNTRPFEKLGKSVDLVIMDSAQNRIKQFSDIELTKGVYTGELQLSSFPVLGDWSLEVSVGGETTKKTFEVAKYVLPKFEVQIDTPRDVTVFDGKIRAIVRSKYTYGKPVKGTAKVLLKPQYRIWNFDEQPYAEKTVPVDGKGKIEFDLKELSLTIDKETGQYPYYPPMVMTAVVEEELTGLKQNSTANINLYRYKYKIESLPDNPSLYTPDIPLKFRVAVKNCDNTPVIDTTEPVSLEIERYYHQYDPRLDVGTSAITTPGAEPENEKLKSSIDKQGIATFEITIPAADNSTTHFSLKAKYRDQTGYIGAISKRTPREGDFFVIEIENAKPKLGEDLELKVSSKKDIPYLNYQIVGRGNIIKTDRVDLPSGTTSHVIKVTPTFEMVPTANIMVYFVRNGNLNFEETNVNFENELENFVDLKMPEQAKPGEDVNIKVSTSPDSYVGLLGVDQSVLLLKSGNDISQSAIFSEMRQFNTRTPWIRGWGRYPGQQSGLVTMTNAHYPFDEKSPKYRSEGDGLHEFGSMSRSRLRGGNDNDPKMLRRVTHDEESKVPEEVNIRKNFLDTWIWNVFEGGNGEIMLKEKVPDTITSWVLTGFSVNSKTGLGLTKEASKLKVFQPFFVSTNLPYSVKRGEVISVPVIVFNYMEKDLDAEVTMDNTDQEFEFTEATNEIDEKSTEETKRTKRFLVPANSGKSVSFMVRPKKVGHMAIKVQATTPISGDAIQQMLLVEPEGVTQYVNKAVFINLKDKKEQSEKVKIEIPEDAVPDSQYVEIGVVNDLLGPTVKNIDKLVRMPYGCGEQNMVNFVPNILVMRYLRNIGQLSPTIETKAKKFMELGYQKELTYKHKDGSYSAFGKSDGNGSTWLTAYVVKSFHQATPYIDIDPKVIQEGLAFLANAQTINGNFPEYGRVLDKAYAGNSANGISLTAFTLLAFLENVETRGKYEKNIQKGIQYLIENLDKNDKDIYATAISAYALKLAESDHAEKAKAKLLAMAKSEGDRKWWAKPTEEKKDYKQMWWQRPKSADVEQTSYALLTLVTDGTGEDVLPIIKWLISNRNSNGGFSSTQDTVIGLQALIGFSEKYSGGKTGKVDISFNDDTGANGKISVNHDNSLLLQTHVLSNNAREVSMTATGEGTSLAQVSYKYNVVSKNNSPRFLINPKVKDSAVKGVLEVDVCIKYVPIDDDKQSNMAVVEVNLPSGYTTSENDGTLDALKNTKNVKRIETKNKDSVVVIYFDSLDETEICAPIEATKTSQVSKQKPAAIEVYDYYNTGNRGIAYYSIKSSLCDVCAGDDCGDGCKKPENP